MKVQVKKNKKSITLQFKAGRGREGVDLKDAVMAMGKRGSGGGIDPLLGTLKRRGYESTLTKRTPTVAEFDVSQKKGAVK